MPILKKHAVLRDSDAGLGLAFAVAAAAGQCRDGFL